MALSSLASAYMAPDYIIRIEGTRVRDDFLRYVQSVEYHEGEELSSKIVLNINNPGFRFVDSKAFAEGNKIDLWIGYAGHAMHFQNRGVIVKPNPDMPRTGMPTYQIVAHDRTRALMTDVPRGEIFRNLRDDEIVRILLNRVGIRGAGEIRRTDGLVKRVLKKGSSPWEFIQRLSRLHGFELTVRFDPARGMFIGYWGPPELAEPQQNKYRFSYGTGEPDATLLEFHPNMSLPSQVSKIEIAYTDPKTRRSRRLFLEVDRARAERTRFVAANGTERLRRPVGNGPSVTFTIFGQREEVIADYPFLTPKQARRLCAAWWARREREFIFARGVLLGQPDLRKGQVHEFVLPSKRLSGDWMITSVVQRLAGGAPYETEFTATKKALQSFVGPGDVKAKVKSGETEQ